jgi:NAD(P)-dependent dehydrogenase (short-subunit alcohol dehydrogenase family)
VSDDNGLLTDRDIQPRRAGERQSEPGKSPRLREPRRCYICRKTFRELHWFYDKMCPPCAALNHIKREQLADLHGYTCFVTGCRIKIGYHICLRLLRSGATVLGTSRFPHDALRRFQQETDYESFADRLRIFGIDLCVLSDVERLCQTVISEYPDLDVVINNAAVTIEKPAEFFADLITYEKQAALESGNHATSTTHVDASEGSVSRRPLPGSAKASTKTVVRVDGFDRADAALWPSLAPTSDQPPVDQTIFSVRDEDDQIVDLRAENSWRTPLERVSTSEFLRVQACNLFAPFVIMKTFGAAMMQQRTLERRLHEESRHKYIINVSGTFCANFFCASASFSFFIFFFFSFFS